MTTLTEALDKRAGDTTCMAQLSQRCGLDTAAGRPAYLAAAETVADRLMAIGTDHSTGTSLLRTVRSFQELNPGQAVSHFSEQGDTPSDELVRDIFGPDVERVVADLASQLAVSDDQAEGLLEITASVAIATLAELAGNDMTLATLREPLAGGDTTGDGSVRSITSAGPAPAGPAAATGGAGSEERPRSKALLVSIPVMVVLAVVGTFVLTTGGSEETDSPTLAFAETTPTSEESVDSEASTTTEDTDQVPEETVDETDTDDSGAVSPDSPPVPLGAPENYTVISRGTIYLRGHVPSDTVEGLIVAAVEEFAGAGNVVSEYEIDPSRPFEPGRSAPVYIEDTVLFASGSAELSDEFLPLLGIGLTLLQTQPDVTIEIAGHTDSDGSAAANLALSQARVDAVKGFFVSQGIAPERITAVGKGETEPRASNDTVEGREANRRVEFLVNDFSFG